MSEQEGAEPAAETDWREVQAMFLAAPAAMAVVRGPEHVHLAVNPAYCERLGRARGELLGRGGREALPEPAAQGLWELCDRVRASGERACGKAFLVRAERGGGQRDRFFNWVGEPMRAPAGGDRIMLVAIEITEHVREQNRAAALALAEREARREADGARERERAVRRWFSTTLQSIGDAVLATDRDGRVTFMNAVAERITGWREHEARGRPLDEVFSIFAESTGAPIESPATRVLREGAVVGLANHTILRARSGATIPIDDSGAPIRDELGNLYGVVLVFRDVSIEMRAQRRRAFLAGAVDALISSLDYHQTLATVAQLAVPELADWCSVDIAEPGEPEAKTGRPGPVRVRQLAVAHSDPAKVAYARELGERYPPDPDAQSGAPQVIRTGRSELYQELSPELLEANVRSEDHRRIVRELHLKSAMVVPFPGRDGRALGAISFIYADSNRRYTEEDLRFAEDFAKRAALAIENARALKAADAARAREQLMRREAELANSAKDEFLATVSHELRTPLTAILGWTSMLRRRALSPELERGLGVVERNARAQARLIDDILDISRIVSGKLTLALGPVDVGEALRQAIDGVRPAAEAKSISLRASTAGDLTILADADRLHQILWNLLSNAIKFTPKGGAVECRASRQGSELCVEIEDSGEGIRADALPHIFDPFRQADNSTTRRHGGLGLGLSLVRQLVTAHGGSVHARSEGEGRGARFTVQLPARAVTPALARAGDRPRMRSPEQELHALPRLEGLSVLVVDDEPDAKELVGETFQMLGATVHLAASAAEGLELLASAHPDVIVSDIGMPVMDGYTFIGNVRALTPQEGGKTPAVALTAYSRPEDARRALTAGFQRYLAKPVDPAELVAIVASLGKRTLNARIRREF